MSEVIGISPLCANWPSCALYIRGESPDGSTQIRDWSLNRATITRVGSVAQSTTSPIFPPAKLNFPGSSYLTVPANSRFSLLGNTDWVIVYWWEWSGTGYYMIGYGGGGDTWLTTNGRQWNWVPQPGANANFQFNNNGKAVNNSFSLSCPTGTKSCVAMINKGSTTTCSVYVNGSQVTTFSTAKMVTSVSSPSTLNIGCSAHSGDGYIYTGSLDEFGIWNGANGKVPTIEQLYSPYRRFVV